MEHPEAHQIAKDLGVALAWRGLRTQETDLQDPATQAEKEGRSYSFRGGVAGVPPDGLFGFLRALNTNYLPGFPTMSRLPVADSPALICVPATPSPAQNFPSHREERLRRYLRSSKWMRSTSSHRK